MRLSLGQELRMVQKQILAPRMIQSMEILQLPIMALQERIDQELQENPILDLQEEDPDLPSEEADRESPDAPSDEERELVIDEAKDNATSGILEPIEGAKTQFVPLLQSSEYAMPFEAASSTSSG